MTLDEITYGLEKKSAGEDSITSEMYKCAF
jgi:hypothetical protein